VLAAALALLLAAAPAEPAPPSELRAALRAGEAAFARRGDPARLAEAIAAFERARTIAPDDLQAELGLARAQAFRALSQPAAAGEAALACAGAAERALRLAAPGWAAAVDRGEEAAKAVTHVGRAGAEPLYLLGSCGMDLARARGFSAVLAAKDELRAIVERAAELDPAVDQAGPHRALGAWIAALPSGAGGGAARARSHFDRARSLAPHDLLARVREAETWAVLVQDRARFLALLDEVLAAGASHPSARSASRAPENAVAREQARALRKRVDRLF
jgi:hypothetical protein